MNWCFKITNPLHLTTLVLIIILPIINQAQTNKYDTSFFLSSKKGLIGALGKSISVSNPISGISQNAAEKNAAEFEPFRGKVIRRIIIRKIGFNKSVNDTSFERKNFFNDLGNILHTSTRNKVILNNLFFNQSEQQTDTSPWHYLVGDREQHGSHYCGLPLRSHGLDDGQDDQRGDHSLS